MNNQAKNYIEQIIEPEYEANTLGFLFINYYTSNGCKYDNSKVFVINYNKPHTSIEEIDWEKISGKGNGPKINSFVKSKQKAGFFTTQNILRNMKELENKLKKDSEFVNAEKPYFNFSKRTYGPLELKNICSQAANIQKSALKKLNGRATNFCMKPK